jgi:mannan endo-1,4-beta-mannosidase
VIPCVVTMKRPVIRRVPLLLTLALASCVSYETVRRPALATTPEDAAHAATKAEILAALGTLQEAGGTLSGQNVGHADWYDPGLMDVEGTVPALLGVDLGYGDLSDVDHADEIDLLADHWRAGGLVTASFHPANPDTGRDCKDKRFSDYAELLDPATRIGGNWEAMLSRVADALQRLKDRHVIVLFRPLHEANGGWFWWGNDRHRPSADEFVAVWRAVHGYFTVTRRLDNLLWVYSANVTYRAGQPRADAYYPGDAYVDVLGLDFYDDNAAAFDERGDWTAMAGLAASGNKVLAVTEIGATQTNPRWDATGALEVLEGRQAAYFLAWHSWPEHAYALRDALNGAAVLADPRIVNLGEFAY